MLLLLHGQILLFIPAALFLGLAASLLLVLARLRRSERYHHLQGLVFLILFASGIIGVFCLVGFLSELSYWVKYSG
jgi:hypothetical protein